MKIIDRSCLRVQDGLPCFQIPEISALGWVEHAFLTRRGGISLPPYDSLNVDLTNGDREEEVLKNRGLIARAFRFRLEDLVLLNQRHLDGIVVLGDPLPPLPSLLEYDALISTSANRLLGIQTADCIPLLIVDPKERVVAGIHAGRRGTGLRIISKVLARLKNDFGSLPSHLLVAIGPSIGPCCYEIDRSVFRPEWKPYSIPTASGGWKVDLAKVSLAHLKAEGIREENIFWVNLCTRCHRDLFFSYRAEGRTGRQLSFIGIIA